MLSTLRIENLAIIDELELDFGAGMNVLTGETGAGKSIIAGALGLVLGARASSETVRHGAEQGSVEALFDVRDHHQVDRALEAAGLPRGEGELLVRRVLSRSGRSRVYINGSLATLQTLAGIAGPLVDVSSQHEQYSLANPANHLDLLDDFASLDAERARLAAGYATLSTLRRELEGLRTADSDRAARKDYLQFQIDEIDEAALRAGEDEELRTERNRLRNAEELRSSANEAEELLYQGRDAAADRLESVRQLVGRLSDLDPELSGLSQRVEALRIELEDVAYELRAYREGIDVDPGCLEEVEGRLETIARLCRKHGQDVGAVLARRDALADELAGLDTASERRETLEGEIAALEARLLDEARGLSERRRKSAARLEKDVRGTLKSLAMERCRLRVAFEERPLHAEGIDRVEWLVETNVGEGFQPLARVASGGELSRLLLAVKRALTDAGSVAAYVFDEVDAGVGGAVAETVGRLLAETARHHQVLCITHLAQVASYADRHFHVGKQERDGRTVTRVTRLSEVDVVEELARLVGGVALTSKTRAHAEEMRKAATRWFASGSVASEP